MWSMPKLSYSRVSVLISSDQELPFIGISEMQLDDGIADQMFFSDNFHCNLSYVHIRCLTTVCSVQIQCLGILEDHHLWKAGVTLLCNFCKAPPLQSKTPQLDKDISTQNHLGHTGERNSRSEMYRHNLKTCFS